MQDKNLSQIIREYVETKKGRDPKLGMGKFYPSSVGKCERAIVYQMLGYPQKPKDSKSYLILENGTYFHDRAEALIRETGVLIASELPLKDPDLHISGRLDLIIKNLKKKRKTITPIELKDAEGEVVYAGPSEDVMIVELKSISNSGFERLSRPRKDHTEQVILYQHMTGIKDGLLLYENKNTQELLEFDVPYNEKTAKEIIKKIHRCIKSFEENSLPEKPFEKHDFDCSYCDFREICWPSNHKYNINDII